MESVSQIADRLFQLFSRAIEDIDLEDALEVAEEHLAAVQSVVWGLRDDVKADQ